MITVDSITSIFFPRPRQIQKSILLLEQKSSQLQLPTNRPDIITALNYHDPTVATAVKYFKTHSDRRLTRQLARLSAQSLADIFPPANLLTTGHPIVLIPIPASPGKPFDHMAIFTKIFCQELKLLYQNQPILIKNDLLQWKNYGQKQALCTNRAARFKNRENAFTANQNSFEQCIKQSESANLFIVDDVITSGATLAAAKTALTDCGLQQVSLFAIAGQSYD